jgi:hypothetical protein
MKYITSNIDNTYMTFCILRYDNLAVSYSLELIPPGDELVWLESLMGTLEWPKLDTQLISMRGDSNYSHYLINTVYLFPIKNKVKIYSFARRTATDSSLRICISTGVDQKFSFNFNNPPEINLNVPYLGDVMMEKLPDPQCKIVSFP